MHPAANVDGTRVQGLDGRWYQISSVIPVPAGSRDVQLPRGMQLQSRIEKKRTLEPFVYFGVQCLRLRAPP